MKKIVSILVGITFLQAQGFSLKHPVNIWGVNLTDKEVEFKYKQRKKMLVGIDYHYFKVPPMSVSDGISSHGYGVAPVEGPLNNGPLTFIAYGNHTHFASHAVDRTKPDKSKKLEDIVKQEFKGKKPEEVIKNWKTFKR